MEPYYYWFLGGIVLLILEMFIPGLVIIFFGFGAIVTATLTAIFDLPVTWEIVIFIVTSILSLMIFRRYFLKKFEKPVLPEEKNDLIGGQAIVLEEIKPNMTGKVLFRDAPWKAIADTTIEQGETVEIVNSENITLFVKPLSGK